MLRKLVRMRLVVALALAVAVPALPALGDHFSEDEGGHKVCSSSAHVYVKADYENDNHNKIEGPGGLFTQETVLGSAGTNYLNYTYANDEDQDDSDYSISASNLDFLNSWPGCITD